MSNIGKSGIPDFKSGSIKHRKTCKYRLFCREVFRGGHELALVCANHVNELEVFILEAWMSNGDAHAIFNSLALVAVETHKDCFNG